MPELLAPAGNFEKMKAALLYGADAVYLSGKAFGMRAAAGNFEPEELFRAFAYAHDRGKKVYLTVNVTPHTDEYDDLTSFLELLKDSKAPDALIVADVGVLSLARKILPDVPLHISTQAGAVSHADCTFWYEQGASRVVLARELSLEEIRKIRRRTPDGLELEAFIHGSMCVAFSGRCMLSHHLTGRDANRGECAQPCRWKYRLFELSEEKRPDMRLPLTETDQGTFLFGSRDLSMIGHVGELMTSGLSSFKIEGRMKSAYYAAVTTNAYRIAIDRYTADPAGYRFDPALAAELESVSHRAYSTGFYFDSPADNPQLAEESGYLADKAYLAVALSYDPELKTARFVQKNKFRRGDRVELLTPGSTGRAFSVSELCDEEGNPIDCVPHPHMPFLLSVPFPVRPGDILRMG